MKLIIYSSDVVGVQSNCVYPHRHEASDAASLSEAVRRDHVCAEYQNHYRGKDNYLTSNCVVMDVDNDHTENPDEWITPEVLAFTVRMPSFFSSKTISLADGYWLPSEIGTGQPSTQVT